MLKTGILLTATLLLSLVFCTESHARHGRWNRRACRQLDTHCVTIDMCCESTCFEVCEPSGGCCECVAQPEMETQSKQVGGQNYTTVIDSPEGKVRLTFDIENGVVVNAETSPLEEPTQ